LAAKYVTSPITTEKKRGVATVLKDLPNPTSDRVLGGIKVIWHNPSVLRRIFVR